MSDEHKVTCAACNGVVIKDFPAYPPGAANLAMECERLLKRFDEYECEAVRDNDRIQKLEAELTARDSAFNELTAQLHAERDEHVRVVKTALAKIGEM